MTRRGSASAENSKTTAKKKPTRKTGKAQTAGAPEKTETKVVVSVSPDRHQHVHDYATSRGLSIAALLRNAIGILAALHAALSDHWLIVVAEQETLDDEVASWGKAGWQIRVPHLPLQDSGRARGSQGASSKSGNVLNIATSVDFKDELKRLASAFGTDSIQDFVLLAFDFEERCFREERVQNRKIFLARSRMGYEDTAAGAPPGAWEISLPVMLTA